jgi:hypothetical protein
MKKVRKILDDKILDSEFELSDEVKHHKQNSEKN